MLAPWELGNEYCTHMMKKRHGEFSLLVTQDQVHQISISLELTSLLSFTTVFPSGKVMGSATGVVQVDLTPRIGQMDHPCLYASPKLFLNPLVCIHGPCLLIVLFSVSIWLFSSAGQDEAKPVPSLQSQCHFLPPIISNPV